jgi:hypothetical protein
MAGPSSSRSACNSSHPTYQQNPARLYRGNESIELFFRSCLVAAGDECAKFGGGAPPADPSRATAVCARENIIRSSFFGALDTRNTPISTTPSRLHSGIHKLVLYKKNYIVESLATLYSFCDPGAPRPEQGAVYVEGVCPHPCSMQQSSYHNVLRPCITNVCVCVCVCVSRTLAIRAPRGDTQTTHGCASRC